MALKTLKPQNFQTLNQEGVTFVELTVAIAILIIITTSILFTVNPAFLKSKSRDEKRLSDLQTLDRVIAEYQIDNGVYPDLVDTTRTSTSLPSGALGPLQNISGNGWIIADMSIYDTTLPIDPINNATYFYSYRHTTSGYELNAVLETLSKYSLNTSDGGNDDTVYEIGNDLSIL